MSKFKRPGMMYAAIARLDALMALGEGRGAAKREAEMQGRTLFGFTTGKIHSYQTRTNYQQHVLHFLNWVRATHGIRSLDEVDERADELASAYLTDRIGHNASPWTVAALRSALRLFFSNRSLALQVALPPRHREAIVRSRSSAAQEKEICLDNWQPLIHFLKASGLRRCEVRRLLVKDIFTDEREVWILVRVGKGGKQRKVPVLAGFEQAIREPIIGLSGESRVFPTLPAHLDIQAYRRDYAQAYYQQVARRPLPPPTGRLTQDDYDEKAILLVSQALGHNRKDVVLFSYLR